MSDYISREAAIADFEYCTQENSTWTPQRVKTLLMRIPTADVEPVVHGRWEHKKNDYSVAWCSKCKGLFDTTWHGKTAKEYFAQFVEAYRYCPRCGSEMDLEELK